MLLRIVGFLGNARSVVVTVVTIGFTAVVGVAIPAYAAIPDYQTISFTPDDIRSSLCGVVDWMFYGLIVLSVIMVLVSAFLFLTAAGDAEKVTKARKTLTYAAIAIVVALAAKGFPALIASFIGASGSGNLSC